MMKGWILWTGYAVVAAFLAAAIWPFVVLRDAFILVTAICLVGALANLVVKKRTSRYDLAELKRVHERAGTEALEALDAESFDSVSCLHCGTVYALSLPVCPRCRRSQFG